MRYLAGMAGLAVPVLGYLGAVGALGAMFEEYILNNFVHVASAKDAGFWEIRRYLIENGYGWESLKPVLLMAGAVIVRLLIYRGEPERFKREKGLLACAATVAVANMLAAYVSGTGFDSISPGTAPCCGLSAGSERRAGPAEQKGPLDEMAGVRRCAVRAGRLSRCRP